MNTTIFSDFYKINDAITGKIIRLKILINNYQELFPTDNALYISIYLGLSTIALSIV